MLENLLANQLGVCFKLELSVFVLSMGEDKSKLKVHVTFS